MTAVMETKLIGKNNFGFYRVNVKNTHPSNKIGDGGMIRVFESKTDTENYVDKVNDAGMDIFVSTINYDEENDVICEEITWYQAKCKRLTDEQITAINQTRKLPKGAKIIKTWNGEYQIIKDPFNIHNGTQKLPEGYEIRKDLLGFTHIMLQDTEGPFIANK